MGHEVTTSTYRWLEVATPRLRCAVACGSERSLRRRETRDRHTERTAGDVIQPDMLTKCDRRWITAVFTANSQLQRVFRRSALACSYPYHLTNAFDIDRDKRILRNDPSLDILR